MVRTKTFLLSKSSSVWSRATDFSNKLINHLTNTKQKGKNEKKLSKISKIKFDSFLTYAKKIVSSQKMLSTESFFVLKCSTSKNL
jgi:hypothetical protein